MSNERHSVYVYTDEIVIWGVLTVQEVMEYIIFYADKGFNEAIWGHENSTLRLTLTKNKEEQNEKDE